MKQFTFITTFAISLLFSLSFVACSEDKQAEHTEETGQTASASTVDAQKEAQDILAGYLQIKDALVKTDGAATSKAAKELMASLGEGTGADIHAELEQIAAIEDPAQQRQHFNTLSEKVYAMLKATKAHEGTIYKQYCPMAFDNKGAFWLAAEKEINNPYFGDMMLHCGKVEEKL